MVYAGLLVVAAGAFTMFCGYLVLRLYQGRD